MFYTVNLSQDRSKENLYLSTTLLEKIQKNISAKKKTIIYLNKRGAFSSLICQDCSYLFECPNCDTSFSVHHHPDRLLCHLCGTQDASPISCKKCHGNRLKQVWVGTQQIESSLKEIYSSASIYRFDSDSMKTKTAKKEALEHLQNADIIIGTKMITTGFDFKNVWLIWVILLEQELSYPQYNIEEKVYTNMKQLIGRWERKGEKTDFVLQTFIPENDFVKHITEGNYKDFLKTTLDERKIFSYPPFTEMITLEYRDRFQEKAEAFISMLHNKITIFNSQGLYSVQLVNIPFRRNNQYHYKIIIKWDKIQELLHHIQPEIIRNSKLSLIWE